MRRVKEGPPRTLMVATVNPGPTTVIDETLRDYRLMEETPKAHHWMMETYVNNIGRWNTPRAHQ